MTPRGPDLDEEMRGFEDDGGHIDLGGEDPGECGSCNQPFELVRPGKSQPTCGCWDAVSP